MRIYPAIDLKDGRCVRLEQGKADRETVYFENPIEAAQAWKTSGVDWIHVVDLDGAFGGKPGNLAAVRGILKLGLKIQLGGGMRSQERIEEALESGVSRVVIGTKAAEDPQFVADMVKKFGKKIAVGIDAKDNLVAIRGWVSSTALNALDFALQMYNSGVETLIYTDISRDGMLTGPNIEAQQRLLETVNCKVIASGGVSTEKDLHALAQLGQQFSNLDGVIVGKALYENRFDLGEAVKQFHKS